MKMTAYQVFLLVFVMWAVHSHGRAYEPESIIFNNTQLPYKENMNPDTVIQSNMKCFRFFYLALQWPNSYCSKPASRPRPQLRNLNYFTIHGLWLQQIKPHCYGCSESTHFSYQNLVSRRPVLVQNLTSLWPNLNRGEQAYFFWSREYERHGFCFFRTPELYFETTFRMMENIPALTGRPDNGGLHPGFSYRLIDLRQLILSVTGKHPVLICDRGFSRIYLREIRFCFQKDEVLFNCPPYLKDSCWSGPVFLPNSPRCGT